MARNQDWKVIFTHPGFEQRQSVTGILLTLVKLSDGWHALRDDPIKGVHTVVRPTQDQAWRASQRKANN
jgi:hypothetical protein